MELKDYIFKTSVINPNIVISLDMADDGEISKMGRYILESKTLNTNIMQSFEQVGPEPYTGEITIKRVVNGNVIGTQSVPATSITEEYLQNYIPYEGYTFVDGKAVTENGATSTTILDENGELIAECPGVVSNVGGEYEFNITEEFVLELDYTMVPKDNGGGK